MKEKEWIERFADKWNERFREYACAYVGRIHVKHMLKVFLKAYKRRKK